jgi:GT2 family glycosyltransferase
MPKVTVVQVIYNSRKFIEPVFTAIFNQTFKDFEVVAVISGNKDFGKELLMEKFPKVRVIDPGFNIGFSAGHNLVFQKSDSEFFQLVNPDLILDPAYLENILKAFADQKVGAATGKLFQLKEADILNFQALQTAEGLKNLALDSTGVNINKSGRAWDRGQHEADLGQYDEKKSVSAVSGAGCMYRRAALEAVKLPKASSSASKNQEYEYFDEDFHSYWEDVDLSWRMRNAGWKNVFMPQALGFHSRGAGSSPGGYVNIAGFISHHRALPANVRKLNYKNHIFMYVKNSPFFYPQFFIREFFMFWYILFFEPATLQIFPELLKTLPNMWEKRKLNISYLKALKKAAALPKPT